jgi:hypothetical protein
LFPPQFFWDDAESCGVYNKNLPDGYAWRIKIFLNFYIN